MPTVFAGLGRVGDSQDCSRVVSVSALKDSVRRPDLRTLSIDGFAIEAAAADTSAEPDAELGAESPPPSCAIGLSTGTAGRVLPHGLEGFEWVGSQSRTTALRAEVFDVSFALGEQEQDLCSPSTEIEEFRGQYTFLGCFKDDFDREFKIKGTSRSPSIKKCDIFCQSKSYEDHDFKYFALQGPHCFCAEAYGTDPARYFETEASECGQHPYMGNEKYSEMSYRNRLPRDADFRNAVYERNIETIVTAGEIAGPPGDLIVGRLPIQNETLFVESPGEHPFLKVENDHCSYEGMARDGDFDPCAAGLKNHGGTAGDTPGGRRLLWARQYQRAHDQVKYVMNETRSEQGWLLSESKKVSVGDNCRYSKNFFKRSCPDECVPSYTYTSDSLGCFYGPTTLTLPITQELKGADRSVSACRKLCGDKGADHFGMTRLKNCHCRMPSNSPLSLDKDNQYNSIYCSNGMGHYRYDTMAMHSITRTINKERFCSMASGDGRTIFETACRISSASACKKVSGPRVFPHLQKDSVTGDKCVNAKGESPHAQALRCPTRCYYEDGKCIKAGTTDTLCKVSLFQTAAIDKATCKSKCDGIDGCKGFTFSDDPGTLPIKGTYAVGKAITDDECVGRVYFGSKSTQDIMLELKKYNYFVQWRQEGDILQCNTKMMGGDPAPGLRKHCVCQPNQCFLHMKKDIDHAPKTGSTCGVLEPTKKPPFRNYAIRWTGFLHLRAGTAGGSVQFQDCF